MKYVLGTLAITALIIAGCTAAAQDEKKSESKLPQATIDSLSYALGVNISENIEKQGFPGINYDLLSKGMSEAVDGTAYIAGKDAQMFIQKVMKQQTDMVAEENLKDAEEYLAKKTAEKDVKTTASGLAYKVIKAGTGAQPAGPTANVTVHYHGTLPDGTVFDSSKDRGQPYTTGLNQVIKGWTEGVQLMKAGAIYEFYIHPDLAYGANPRPGVIKPNNALVFEVELISVN